jgi:hypothetical protein
MLPIIKTKVLPSIGDMHFIAMRYIFERPSVSLVDMRVLEEGLDAWSKRPDLTQSDRWELTRITNALIADENGHFNRAKALLAKSGLHYRQFYKVGLPYITDPEKCRTFGKV